MELTGREKVESQCHSPVGRRKQCVSMEVQVVWKVVGHYTSSSSSSGGSSEREV